MSSNNTTTPTTVKATTVKATTVKATTVKAAKRLFPENPESTSPKRAKTTSSSETNEELKTDEKLNEEEEQKEEQKEEEPKEEGSEAQRERITLLLDQLEKNDSVRKVLEEKVVKAFLARLPPVEPETGFVKVKSIYPSFDLRGFSNLKALEPMERMAKAIADGTYSNVTTHSFVRVRRCTSDKGAPTDWVMEKMQLKRRAPAALSLKREMAMAYNLISSDGEYLKFPGWHI